MRYRLPKNCRGVSHDGVMLEVAPEGTVEATEDAAADLAPHGLTPIKAPELAGRPEPARDPRRR